MDKEKEVFRTWNELCLFKLKQMGKTTIEKWAVEMGYSHDYNMIKIIKDNRDKLKISGSRKLKNRPKFVELKEGIEIK